MAIGSRMVLASLLGMIFWGSVVTPGWGEAAEKVVPISQRWEGHTDSVSSLAFSPDGSKLASASLDRTIRIWEVPTGKSVRVLEGHANRVLSVAYSPKGDRLVSTDLSGVAKVWDAETGKELKSFRGKGWDMHAAVFSPDGKRIALSGCHRSIYVWDLASDAKKEFRHTAQSAEPIYWTADGKSLVLALLLEATEVNAKSTVHMPGSVVLMDAATGKVTERYHAMFKGASPGVVTGVWGPDEGGKMLLADSKIWRLDTKTKTGEMLMDMKMESMDPMVFSKDGKAVAVASRMGGIVVRVPEKPVAAGDEKAAIDLTLPIKTREGVWGMAFSPDGKYFAYGAANDHYPHLREDWPEGKDNGVYLVAWQKMGGRDRVIATVGPNLETTAVDPTRGEVLLGEGTTIRIIDLKSKEEKKLEMGFRASMRMWVSPDGKYLAYWGEKKGLVIVNRADGKLLANYISSASSGANVVFDGDRVHFTGRSERPMVLKIGEPQPKAVRGTVPYSVQSWGIVPGSKERTEVLSGSNAVPMRIVVRDIETGNELREVKIPYVEGQRRDLAGISGNGRMVALLVVEKKGAVQTRKLLLADVASGKVVEGLPGQKEDMIVTRVSFSEDGSRFMYTDGASIVVMRTADQKVLWQYPGFHGMRLSDDGKWVLMVRGDKVHAFEVDEP